MTLIKKILRITLNAILVLYAMFQVFILFITSCNIEWYTHMVLEIAYTRSDIDAMGILIYLLFIISLVISAILFALKKKVFGTLYLAMAVYSLFLYFICEHFDYLFVYGVTPRWIVDIVNFVW